jgi:hypothetical protein
VASHPALTPTGIVGVKAHEIHKNFHALDRQIVHWLGDSNFSAKFTVKNVVCFSDIFQ